MHVSSLPAIPNYQILFQSLPGIYLVLSPQLLILAVNDNFVNLTGVATKDLLDQPIQVLYAGESPAVVAEQTSEWQKSVEYVQAHRAPHTLAGQDLFLGKKNAENRYWQRINNPVFAESGELAYIIHEVKDITAEHLATENARQSQDLFKMLSLATNDAIWDWNLRNNTVKWNAGYRTLFGLPEPHPTINSWYDFIHDEDRERVVQGIHAVINSNHRFWSDEYRFRCADGSYSDVLDRGYLLYDATGAYRMVGSMQDITLYKKAQHQLNENTNFFQFLAETVPTFIWTSNPDGITDYRNQYYYDFVGLEITRQPDFNWINPIHPDDREKSHKKWLHSVATGHPYEVEHRLQAKSGDYRWLLSRARPMRNQQGEIIKWFGTSTDIHEHKEYQQQLLHQDARLQRMLHEAPIQLCILKGPAQLITYQNLAFTAALGNQNFEGQNAREAWPGINGQSFITYVEQVYKTGIAFKANNQLGYYDDGSGEFKAGYFNLNYQPLRNNDNAIEGVLCFSVDVTDQVQARQEAENLARELQIETGRFKLLAEAMPQKVWTAKPNGDINYYNHQWLQYTGLSFDELKNWGWQKIMHPNDLSRINQTWENALLTGNDLQMENRLRRTDGVYRWHLTRGLPMRNEQGEIVMWVGTNTDIHEQKLAQESLQETNAELKRINEDLDRFVYTASHDLKLPIINMGSLFNEIMDSSQFSDPEHDKLVEMFHKSLDQIHATITDLSEITKVQKNLNAEKVKINLPQLTDEICLSIQDVIQNSSARIISDFAALSNIEFSKANLRSILYNLISNALKYRSPNRTPDIYISTALTEDYYVLTVKDNGLGINLDRHRDKLFQMFKRFHSHVPGTGLGLYMINRIMQNNNGHIEVESSLDAGSTFRIYFRKF